MKDDPIVSEVRRNRIALLESFGGDFGKLSRDAMRRQWQSGRIVVKRELRKPRQGTSPNAYAALPHD
jgi:hypothetical protein